MQIADHVDAQHLRLASIAAAAVAVALLAFGWRRGIARQTIDLVYVAHLGEVVDGPVEYGERVACVQDLLLTEGVDESQKVGLVEQRRVQVHALVVGLDANVGLAQLAEVALDRRVNVARDLVVVVLLDHADPAHEELVQVEIVLLLIVLDELVDVEGGLLARL